MLINIYTSVSWYITRKEIKITTDSGRSCRPIIIADKLLEISKINDGKLNIQDLNNYIRSKYKNWYHLLGLHNKNLCSYKKINYDNIESLEYDSNYYEPDLLLNTITKQSSIEKYYLEIIKKLNVTAGLIEYIDTEEANNTLIAIYPNQLFEDKDNKYTHSEIHPMLMLGVLGSIIPFVDSNQYPRNLFSTGQSKQAISIYSTNYKNRMDTEGQIIYYGEKPIVKTRFEQYLNTDKLPYGMNAVIAIACYSGYNQEDSIIINKSSVDRGLFRTMIFKTYVDQEKNIEYTDLEEKFRFNAEDNVINRKPGNYSKLNKDGIIKEFDDNGQPIHVDENDVIISKVIEQVDNSGNIYYTDNSMFIKRTQQGYIDKVYVDTQNDGLKFCKIRIRKEKRPEMGDKFCSRHGQKGVIGMILPRKDMPFTKDGIVPDMIINPHAIPSRMTIGQFVECVMGKAGSMLGIRSDSTGFTNIDKNKMCGVLEKCGFEKYSNEVLYNGINGKQLNVSIFMGPTFYLRLTHQVSKKMYSRATGPNTMLTRQPLGGRSAGGGLRIGEMERDALLSHGASLFLKESVVERSDKYEIHVSDQSGLLAIVNEDENIYKDFSSDEIKYEIINNVPHKTQNKISNANYYKIVIPYTFKLLLQELEVMNIGTRIMTRNTLSEWTHINKDNEKFLYSNFYDEDEENEQLNANNNSNVSKPIHKFHEFIKNKLIEGSTPIHKEQKSILDLSYGIGDNIHKYSKFNKIYVNNKDSKNIGNKNDKNKKTLWSKFNNIKQTRNSFKYKEFIPLNYDISKTSILKDKSLEKHKFDVVTIFFNIHNIFNKEIKIKNLFNNMKHLLKPNGYCLITCLDGKKVFDELNKSINKNDDNTKYIEEKDEDGNLVYKIEMTKEYLDNLNDSDSLEDSEKSINFPINVTDNNNNTKKEYLVNPQYLINIARLYGLEIITQDELYKDFDKNVFLNATDTFENLSKNMEYLATSFSNQFNFNNLNNNILKNYSNLFRYFIFKNRDDTYYKSYKNNHTCISDLRKQENLSGSFVRQMILTNSSQKNIINTINQQRFNNGPSQTISQKSNFDNISSIYEKLTTNYDTFDQISFNNTLDLLYNQIGEGIYVKIKNKILVSYTIFIKSKFINLIDNNYDINFKEYYEQKNINYEKISFHKQCHKLYEEQDELIHYLSKNPKFSILKYLLLKICNNSRKNNIELNDCEFFVNINNCPILKSIQHYNLESNNEEKLEKNNDMFLKGQLINFQNGQTKTKGFIHNVYKDSLTINYLKNKKIHTKTINYDDVLKIYNEKLKHLPIISFFIDEKSYYYNDLCLPSVEDCINSSNSIFPDTNSEIINTENKSDILENLKQYTIKTAPNSEIKGKFNYYFGSFPKDIYNKFKMDEHASYSITAPFLADQISKYMLDIDGINKNMTITDATACVGGNTISFSKFFKYVNTIEINKNRFDSLKYNINLIINHKNYKNIEKDNIQFFHGDYLSILENKRMFKDVIFFDPPWGGKDCSKKPKINIKLGNYYMDEIVKIMFSKYEFKFVVLKLPLNFDMSSFNIDDEYILLHKNLKNRKNKPKMKLIIIKSFNVENIENKNSLILQKGSGKKVWKNKKNIIFYREYFNGNDFNTNKNLQLRLIVDNIHNKKIDAKFIHEDNIAVFNNGKIQQLPNKFHKHGDIAISLDKEDIFVKEYDVENMKNYKYIICMQNFTNFVNYSKLMSFNSLIIKVKNNSDNIKDWVSDYLKPFNIRNDEELGKNTDADHIEITYSDLNDLYDWLESNQDICEKIIKNNNKLYKKIISEEKIIDCWTGTINAISSLTDLENNIIYEENNVNDNLEPSYKMLDLKYNIINHLLNKDNYKKIIESRYNVELSLTNDIIIKNEIKYKKLKIEGNFKQDIDLCYEYLNKYNNIHSQKFVLPLYKINKNKDIVNIIDKFNNSSYSFSNYFNIKIQNGKQNKDVEWFLDNIKVKGKQQITIYSFNEANINNFTAYLKENISMDKIVFKLSSNSLLNLPILTNIKFDYVNEDLQFDKQFKLAIVTSIPDDVSNSKFNDFQNYMSKLINKIESYNSNIICKFIVINQKKQTIDNKIISLIPEQLFDNKKLEFNKFACYNAAFNLNEDQNYNQIMFHDFDIKIKSEYINDNLINTICTNLESINPILYTHSSKLVNNHILMINPDTFKSINGFSHHLWNYYNGYEELINKLSGGLNWWEYSKNEKVYTIIKPTNITHNYFDSINLEYCSNPELKQFYEKSHNQYRHLFKNINSLLYNKYNDLDNYNNYFTSYNEEIKDNIEQYNIILTNNCNLYHYNLNTIWNNSKNINQYIINCFNTSFSKSIIDNLLINKSSEIFDKDNKQIDTIKLDIIFESSDIIEIDEDYNNESDNDEPEFRPTFMDYEEETIDKDIENDNDNDNETIYNEEEKELNIQYGMVKKIN